MGKKKKRFIPKDQRARFKLVHRSQHDPLTGSEAPQHVLVPMNANAERELEQIYEDENERAAARGSQLPMSLEDEKEEEEGEGAPVEGDDEFGEFRIKKEDVLENTYNPKDYEFGHEGIGGDGYDYSKHMRNIGEGDGFFIPAPEGFMAYRKSKYNKESVKFEDMSKLPASSFPSQYEEEVGLLHLEAYDSRPHLDKDMLQVLGEEPVSGEDEDISYGGLDDDFIMKANARGEGDDDDYDRGQRDFYGEDDDFDDDFDDGPPELEEYDETAASASTSAKMTQNQQDLEDQFQNVLEMYDDDEIGELTHDDPRILGTRDVGDFENILNEYRQEKAREKQDLKELQMDEDDLMLAQRLGSLSLPDKTIELAVKRNYKEQRWDCESITSLYSNTENHPVVIDDSKKIKLSSKTGIPLGVLKQHHQKHHPNTPESDEDDEEDEDEERANLGAKRPKKETREEKRLRKQAVKASKQEARLRKKEVKEEYSKEKTVQLSAQSKNPLNEKSQIRM